MGDHKMTERQTFAVGETIRQRHLESVGAMSDEIASLRARVEAAKVMRKAIRETGIKRLAPALYNAVMRFDALKDTE